MTRLKQWLIHPFTLLALLIVAYSFITVFIVGPVGYTGDGLSLVDKAFWENIPEAYHRGAIQMIRPTMTLYTITAMKLFNYDTVLMTFAAFLTLGSASVMGAAAIRWAFPGRTLLVLTYGLLHFFLPFAISIVFSMTSDNTRLVVFLFWLAVLSFQHWSVKPRIGVVSVLPIIAIVMSALAYESAFVLYLTIPFLVLPVYWRHNQQRSLGYHGLMFIQLMGSIGFAYWLYYFIRFLYGIRSGYENTIDSVLAGENLSTFLEIWWSYFTTLPYAFTFHLDYAPYVPIAIGIGVLTAITAGGLILYTAKVAKPSTEKRPFTESWAYLIFTGGIMAFVGFLPFAVAFYRPSPLVYGFREYSTTGTGIALLLAALLYVPIKPLRYVFGAIMLVAIGFWATATVDVGLTQHEGYLVRQKLHQSLYDTVPGLEPGTTVLLLNSTYIDGDLNINTFLGMRDYIPMFYQDRSILTFALTENDMLRIPIVNLQGFTSIDTGTVPLETIVIIQRVDNDYEVVDKLTSADSLNIAWEDGITELQTNQDRIIQNPARHSRFLDVLNVDYDS